MSNETGLTSRQANVNAGLVYVGVVVAQTGVQLIAPSLPAMGDALGLTDTRLALVMTVYLLPAALGAIPAGILADRIGRRRVFGWSMVLLGIAGFLLQLSTGSFALFLSVRFVQGLAFAGLLPLTMTILGDAFRGPELIRSQGRRSIAMLTGDGILPVLGGGLAALAWQAPWLGQLLAIPFGFMVLTKMTDPPSLGTRIRRAGVLAGFGRVLRMRGVVALQYAGFLRMFIKFSILTFVPFLLVDGRDMSPAFAGLVVGASALIGVIPSYFAGRIAPWGRPTTFIAMGLGGEAVALAVWVLAPWPVAIFMAALAFGVADGLSGVFVNSLVAATPDTEHRGSFVAVTGAVRNLAKFLGPAFVGILLLMMTLSNAFLLIAAVTLLSTMLVVSLRVLDGGLQDQGDSDRPTPPQSVRFDGSR